MAGPIRAILACVAAGLVAIPALSGTAAAQHWPDRPVRFISSQAAGNGTDIIARFVAEQLSGRIGQPVIVENRPGGGNVVGTQAAARSAPDGTTFFFATAAALVTDPYTVKSLPYDPIKAFVPVARVAEVSFVILANPSVPANNLDELIRLAKAEPDKLSIGTSGPKRFSGMVVSWLNKLAGMRITQVPYNGMGPGIQDAIANRIPLVILSLPEGAASLSTGALKPIAVTSLQRVKSLPNVPAIAETVKGFEATAWQGLFAPAGTPQAVIDRLRAATNEVIADKAFDAKLRATLSGKSYQSTPEAFAAQIKSENEKYGALIRTLNLRIQ